MRRQNHVRQVAKFIHSKGFMLGMALVCCGATLHNASAADIPVQSVIGDSFALGGPRQAGEALKGSLTSIGELPWKTVGPAVFRQDGALTTGTDQSIVAYVPIAAHVGEAPFKVQVDCQPATSDWIGLSLGGEFSDFFKTARISLILRPNGNYALYAGSDAKMWDKPLTQGKAAKFDATGWSNLELQFDPAKSALSATINGTDVVRDLALGGNFPAAGLQFAGIRFNGANANQAPMQPNAPAVDNFAVTPLGIVKKVVAPPVVVAAAEKPVSTSVLEPLNRTQFFLQPNTAETLKFRVQGDVPKLTYDVSDYQGRPVLSKTVDVQNGEAQLPLSLAPGFYELKSQPGDQKFGLMVSTPHQGAPDTFFAMDAALSWLETRPEMRTDLLALLKRTGIGLVRERLSWGAVNPKEGQWDWETARQFDTLRQEYQRQGIKVLELFHGAPDWTKIEAANPYPQRLAATGASWQQMDKHWGGAWNALEVWNEPDIETGGELPADQYMPVLKAINYAFRDSKSPTLVGGGVFGYYNPGYIGNAVRNGLLDQSDFVSFHTYAKAPSLQQIIADYRGALTVNGKTVPLWLTESGQPWKSGPARPEAGEDQLSALDITMKAVEARACGIAHYFPFVYPNYIEGQRDFGMMGQEVTPLRSMAGYVQAVAALSNLDYVGDLNLNSAAVQRARVFAKGDKAVVVLYSENPDANSSVDWKGAVTSLQGIDGRILKQLPNGAIPLADGLTYVHTSLQALTGLSRQTVAAQMTAVAKGARMVRPVASSIVLQPSLPSTVQPTKRGYKVADSALAAFPLRVRVSNLANAPRQVRLNCAINGGGTLPVRTVELAPLATTDAEWNVDLNEAFKQSSAEAVSLTITGQEKSDTVTSSLELDLFSERDMPTYLRLYPASTQIDVTDLTRWKANIAPTGQMTMAVDAEKNWQLKSTFKPSDRWVYPDFALPEKATLVGSDGLLIRARALAPATVRLMLKERSGATYFTPFSMIPADGEWHAVALHWPDLAALPSAPPDANGKLDLDQISSISLGMNSKTDENTLEVSDFYVARKPSQLAHPTQLVPQPKP